MTNRRWRWRADMVLEIVDPAAMPDRDAERKRAKSLADQARGSARRIHQRTATPPWASRKAIRGLYALARRLTRERGQLHEVDHIVPLFHPLVCGLHCPANLQVLTGKENAVKNNHAWPGMPCENLDLFAQLYDDPRQVGLGFK